MGSLRFEGILFSIYSHDHAPPHVHAKISSGEVIIDLLPDGNVRLSSRANAIRPANLKSSEVRKTTRVAAENYEELMTMWRNIHDK